MPDSATQAMLRAAMIKAVETRLIPRHSFLTEYLKSWALLEQVIQAALDARPEEAAARRKTNRKPKPKAGRQGKNH